MPGILIPHIDDIGVTPGTVVAIDELTKAGLVTSGSVMVPTPHFTDIAELARRRPELDLGVHLTLNSESDYLKWGPLTEPGPASGLIDENGHFPKTVQQLREQADPAAVEIELRAQVETALESGIAVTHLDHHMGAALNPEFAEITIDLGREFGVPVLFPRRISDYFDLLGKGPVDLELMTRRRDRLEGAGDLIVDHFAMGLEVDGDVEEIYKALIEEADPGVTYLALHCTAPGEIERVHPKDYRRRIDEFHLFANEDFIEWARDQLDISGIRELSPRA